MSIEKEREEGETDREKEDRMDTSYPNLIMLVKGEFLAMCETQKGYIRSIEELNHQVQELISEITTRELNKNGYLNEISRE